MNEEFNQTGFMGQQTAVQDQSLPEIPKPTLEAKEVKKPSPLLFMLVAVVVVAVIVGVYIASTSHTGTKDPLSTPTVAPNSTPSVTALDEQLKPLLDRAEAGDPEKQSLPFPPIDFNLRLQDARNIKN